MIAQNISTKLKGRHYEAFRSFALRSGANTSIENFKRLIETLPEFQNLLSIPVMNSPSVKPDSITPVPDRQGENNSSVNLSEHADEAAECGS